MGYFIIAEIDKYRHVVIKYNKRIWNKKEVNMARKIRGDITVGNLEKKLGVKPGTIRNEDGRDTRSDKLLKTLRKEAEKSKKKP